MNRKGQEAKFLTGFPVLLLLVVIMGIFLGLSFSLAAKRGVEGVSAERKVYTETFLYSPIMVGANEMLVIDAAMRADAGLVNHEDVEHGLQGLLDVQPEGSCLLLALDDAPQPGGKPGGATLNDFYLVKEKGAVHGANIGAYPSLFAPYREAGVLRARSVIVSGGSRREPPAGSSELAQPASRMYFEYYFGRCLS